MADFVLVHGACHGGWCWRAAAARLRAAGHRVYTPTLTGLGERAHLLSPEVNLDTHIADVCGVIEAEELDGFVLVAHSYGGMPVTGAADRMADRVGSLVYLDAFTPADGEAAFTVRNAVPGAVPLPAPKDGMSIKPPPAKVFGVTGEIEAWVSRRMTPHPYASMTQPISLTGDWRSVHRKVYIRTAQYPAPYFDRYLSEAEADGSWITFREDAPHNIMMTDPDWFVGTLLKHALPG